MSYVTSSGGGIGMPSRTQVSGFLEKAGNFVPGLTYAGKKVAEGKTGLAIAAGVVGTLMFLVFIIGLPVAITKSEEYRAKAAGKTGMTTQWLGTRHPNELRLTDLGRTRLTSERKDTFLGHGVGPEFVEQPNYVLGNEDMLRTALSKYNRLKAQGAQVSDWKTFWAAYRAENSDDLDRSMYDFGDGFDAKKLQVASVGV